MGSRGSVGLAWAGSGDHLLPVRLVEGGTWGGSRREGGERCPAL